MNKYGQIAVLSAQDLNAHKFSTPVAAWRHAAAKTFPDQEASQDKGCPKNAFLGLCEEGFVKGVPPGNYSAGLDNKSYAVKAAQLLGTNPRLAASGASELWRLVMDGRVKKPNSQMDVVLSLWSEGFISNR